MTTFNLVGTARLPGGDAENATAMAAGLIAWVEGGGDITAILPGPLTEPI